jgi:hypothetical protein
MAKSELKERYVFSEQLSRGGLWDSSTVYGRIYVSSVNILVMVVGTKSFMEKSISD